MNSSQLFAEGTGKKSQKRRVNRRLRSRKDRLVCQVFLFGSLIGCALLYNLVFKPPSASLLNVEENRRSLQQDNCTFNFIPRSFDEFTLKGQSLCDGDEGYLIVTVFLMLYTFWALAIIVDEYFIPALDQFEESWDLNPEIAGATLMAAGGSAPEFFTNLFSSVNQTTTGFGTIVGSAVFNVLFVIGAVAWFTKEDLELEWWILFRDSSYYSLSIMVLAFFYYCGNNESTYQCKGDGIMTVYESCILFGLYIGYCTLLIAKIGGVAIHRRIKRKIARSIPWIVPKKQRLAAMNSARMARGEKLVAPVDEVAELPDRTRRGSNTSHISRHSRHSMEFHFINEDGEEENFEFFLRPKRPCYKDDDGDEAADIKVTKCVPLRKLLNFPVWVLALPIVGPLQLLVPVVSTDFWQNGNGKNFKLLAAVYEFFMSLVFIAIFTAIMVYSAETFGRTLGIDDVVMGYTILAAGTSAPDLLSSVFVAFKGEGGMAVSSSIGSNIFDITVGLPIPWLISTGIGNTVEIVANSILASLGTLFAMLVAVVLVTMQQGW
eukprot:CAMPEP_0204866196 /NCGR_PEP_ID=MMETSP1348-20121228/16291_1 /ASSEMBLY_ACC=CAM_ASM_000700 /TAXON_ID=215587 /ORGANISM="Aplanochytrium stocchinoi, Strain GSBS06" /LENGTH=546 /DNA_ID=CAMNT_0052017965 /DNA_START=150 /DNA_END=1787 /DNA_ORIENTATION=+